jgi:hypothetical protein
LVSHQIGETGSNQAKQGRSISNSALRRSGSTPSIKYRLLICQYHNRQIGTARLDETMHAEALRPICQQHSKKTQITLK